MSLQGHRTFGMSTLSRVFLWIALNIKSSLIFRISSSEIPKERRWSKKSIAASSRLRPNTRRAPERLTERLSMWYNAFGRNISCGYFFPQEIFFFPQEIFFSARNIFFSARNKFFSARNKFFSARNIFFRKKGKKYFLRKKIYFLRRKIYFLRRKIYFLRRKIYFLRRKIFLAEKKIFLAEKYFYTMLPISFRKLWLPKVSNNSLSRGRLITLPDLRGEHF